MRLLVSSGILGDNEVSEVVQITDICYSAVSIDGKIFSGLHFTDFHGRFCYIPGVTVLQCNAVCKQIYEHGRADVRELGEYKILE